MLISYVSYCESQFPPSIECKCSSDIPVKTRVKLEKLMAVGQQTGVLATVDELYDCATKSVAKSYMPDVEEASVTKKRSPQLR